MMKYRIALLAALAMAGSARASGTQAVSREASFYILPSPNTLAVSREAVFYIPVAATQDVSREATFFVNYRMEDVAKALRIAAGLGAASSTDEALLNVATIGPSATVVDILDAAAIAGYIGHPERLP